MRVPIDTVLRQLKKAYPTARCSLDWSTPLELLVATILSAQCTDKRVNIVTTSLFKTYRSPQDYLAVPPTVLEHDIFSCGTYRAKTKAIRDSCRLIIQNFHGQVPRTMPEMLTLRGVGRKTAAIVLGTAYGIVEGIPVDTHVMRVSKRLGLTRHTQQGKIEQDLMRHVPRKDWLTFSHCLVAHGRAVCIARRPQCAQCVFKRECPSSLLKKRGGRKAERSKMEKGQKRKNGQKGRRLDT